MQTNAVGVKTIRTLEISHTVLSAFWCTLKIMIFFDLVLYNLPLYKVFILYKIKTFWFLVTYQKCYDYNIKVTIQPMVWKQRHSQLSIPSVMDRCAAWNTLAQMLFSKITKFWRNLTQNCCWPGFLPGWTGSSGPELTGKEPL